MNMWTKVILVVVAIVGVGVYSYFSHFNDPIKPRHAKMLNDIVSKFPELRPLYDDANADGKVTYGEMKHIVDVANEQKGR